MVDLGDWDIAVSERRQRLVDVAVVNILSRPLGDVHNHRLPPHG
jgi:hypothetical protein